MARIRIVDFWMRSPVSTPMRGRTIMVVAETWAEQKVLMRAFASSMDQTKPTIGLQGRELPISPAGANASGPWGIHVHPPEDGRAQALRVALQMAARHLAGTKGTPPRLEDEVPTEERKPTSPWIPAASSAAPVAGPAEPVSAPNPGPAATAGQPAPVSGPTDRTMMPMAPSASPNPGPNPIPSPGPAARMFAAPTASNPRAHRMTPARSYSPRPPGASAPTPWPQPRYGSPVPAAGAAIAGASHPGRAATPVQPARARRARQTQLPPVGARTAMGYTPASTPVPRIGRRPRPSLATFVGRTMPVGFQLSDDERRLLEALGRTTSLSGQQIAELLGGGDGHTCAQGLMDKLAKHGLDLLELRNGSYRLRR